MVTSFIGAGRGLAVALLVVSVIAPAWACSAASPEPEPDPCDVDPGHPCAWPPGTPPAATGVDAAIVSDAGAADAEGGP